MTQSGTTHSKARLVIRNARIGSSGRLGTVVIAEGDVAHLGEVTPRATDEVVDAEGRIVLPGLFDAHVHFDQWASWRHQVDVSGARSASDTAALLARTVDGDQALPPGALGAEVVVRGHGFRDGLWSDVPHKSLLDDALPGRAVVVQSNDLHIAWFSQAALDLIGAGDHPTGVLRENACHEALAALPETPTDELDRWVAEAASHAAARGVTGVLDFQRPDNLGAWTRRAGERPLALRVICGINRDCFDDVLARGLQTGAVVAGTDGLVEVGPVKLFVDGSLNTRTALCFDPYPDIDESDEARGVFVMPPEELREVMTIASENGLTCAVHAIGDRANAIALDLFEELGVPGRIEHAQLLTAVDLARVGRPGLTLGVQPAHGPADRDVAERHWAGRTAGAFAYAGMLAAGGRLEIGSDAPVSPLDPWDGIAAAVTRTDDDRQGWHPEQALSLPDALAAASRGRRDVRVGDPADLMLLDDDPALIDPTKLRDLPVAGTLLAGRWTHRAF